MPTNVRLDGVDIIKSQTHVSNGTEGLRVDDVVTKLEGVDLTQGEEIAVTKIDSSTIQDGQVLTYASGKWRNNDITVGQLPDLSDVQSYDPNTLSGTEVLSFDSSLGVWKPMTPAAPSGSAATLDDLTGVTTVNKADDYVLTYDSTLNSGAGGWEPRAQLQGTTINKLEDVSDVNASAPTSGDFLEFDGMEWVAKSPPVVATLTATMSVGPSVSGSDTDWDFSGSASGSATVTQSILANGDVQYEF